MTQDATSSEGTIDAIKSLPYKELGKRFFHEFKDDDVLGLAAEVAYHFMFAIPPILILIVTVTAALNEFTTLPVAEQLRQLSDEHAPAALHDVFDTVIANSIEEVRGGLISFGMLTTAAIAIWSGSNGMNALIKAYNRAYDVEEGRPYHRKRIVAVLLTLLFAVFVNTAFALFFVGEDIGQWIAGRFGLGGVFTTVWDAARLPTAIALFMLLLALLYYLAPDVEQSFRWISPGSVVATLLWIATIFGFQLYLSVADPGSAYGAFGSLIVLLLFVYATSLVLLIGAELNAVLQRRYDDEAVRYRAEHPERLSSDEARAEAAQEASNTEQRTGKRMRNRAAGEIEAEQRARQPASVQVGAGMAAAGVAIGWLLGRRSKGS